MTWDALSQLFEEYAALPVPLVTGYLNLQEADVDMAMADGDIAGLVETFLKRRKVSQSSILLDSSIDTRLDGCVPVTPEEVASLKEFKNYRSKMIELAFALSQVSGVPIEWR